MKSIIESIILYDFIKEFFKVLYTYLLLCIVIIVRLLLNAPLVIDDK